MGKRRKGKKQIETVNEAPDGAFHNPFAAALGGLEREPAPQPDTDDGGGDDDASSGVPSRAVVRKERKGRGGKTVTIVSHLDGLDFKQREAWCKNLRSAMGCGGTVEGDEIVLQGDLRERVQQWLDKQGVKQISVS